MRHGFKICSCHLRDVQTVLVAFSYWSCLWFLCYVWLDSRSTACVSTRTFSVLRDKEFRLVPFPYERTFANRSPPCLLIFVRQWLSHHHANRNRPASFPLLWVECFRLWLHQHQQCQLKTCTSSPSCSRKNAASPTLWALAPRWNVEWWGTFATSFILALSSVSSCTKSSHSKDQTQQSWLQQHFLEERGGRVWRQISWQACAVNRRK